MAKSSSSKSVSRSAKANLSAAAGKAPGSVNLRADLKRFTRERILTAALECFRRTGFRATTVDQIVEAAGMTVPTFYRYFPSKDDLIVPLKDFLDAEVRTVLIELDRLDVSNFQNVRRWFDTYIVMWSRVHRLCDAYWEGSTLDGEYASRVFPDSLETVSVLQRTLASFEGEARARLECRLGLMVLFMDRAALLVVAEETSVQANRICEEFSKILWGVLNASEAFEPPAMKT